MEKYETEIFETEKAFAQLAKEKGLKTAFLTYASDEAVLSRDNTLIKGKEAIAAYFDKQTLHDVSLEWEPDFVQAAASGDLGYTYGKYTFAATDPSGQAITGNGYFHTVWKREASGEWRYVWD